jgi:outer membrane receptor protein involved in Fe transport
MADGTFKFNSVSQEKYQLTVQMLGFEDATQVISINNSKTLPPIVLKEDINQLDEVQVIAERSFLESSLGKKVLRDGQDLANSGTSAAEAMERIPSVTTTQQGGIQIRGSSNVIVYINGKETSRDVNSLRFIPAETLDKIEVITNPSAKYDAEGVAGIVNLVYRKSSDKPLKLDILANVSCPARVLGGANLSFNKQKISGFLNATHSWSDTENLEDSRRFNRLGELEAYQNLIESNGINLRTNLDAGVSFQPDSLTTIDLELNYTRWDDDDDALQTNRLRYRDSRPDEEFINKSERQELENEATVSLSMLKKFKQGQKVSFLLSAGGEDEDNSTRFDELDNSQIPEIAQNFLRTSLEEESQRLYQIKADYETPFFDFGDFETGFKLDFIEYDILQQITFQDEELNIADNDFEIEQEKYGVYFIQKNKFNQFEYALGVRFEHFESDGFQQSTQEPFQQRNTRLFPSLNMLYRFKAPQHSVGISFSQRINRPGFFDVNPFISFTDPVNLQTGNPNLEPEIATLLETNYQFKIGSFNTDLTGFYKHTDEVIQAIANDIGNGQTLQTLTNFDSREDLGLEMLLSFKNTGIFSSNATFNLTHSKFRDIDTTISFNNATAWGFRTDQRIQTKNNWMVEFVQTYRAPRFEPQRETKSQFYIDINLSKKFNNGKASISLNARDIFDTRDFENEIVLDDVRLDRRFKFQTRRITLSLKYRILE